MNELSAEQLLLLQQSLEALQEELSQLVQLSAEGAKPVELDTPIGRLSRMDAMQNQQIAKSNREAHKRRLQLVRAALADIEREDYGLCKRCDEPIGFPRLQAKPESRFCLACQSSSERR